jgi:hypothetical protein
MKGDQEVVLRPGEERFEQLVARIQPQNPVCRLELSRRGSISRLTKRPMDTEGSKSGSPPEIVPFSRPEGGGQLG